MEKSETLLDAALSAACTAPHDPGSWCRLGNVYLPIDPATAAIAFRTALALSARNAEAWCGLACACLQSHEPEAALFAFREASRHDPGFTFHHAVVRHALMQIRRPRAFH